MDENLRNFLAAMKKESPVEGILFQARYKLWFVSDRKSSMAKWLTSSPGSSKSVSMLCTKIVFNFMLLMYAQVPNSINKVL